MKTPQCACSASTSTGANRLFLLKISPRDSLKAFKGGCDVRKELEIVSVAETLRGAESLRYVVYWFTHRHGFFQRFVLAGRNTAVPM